jgi:hypothetical protein
MCSIFRNKTTSSFTQNHNKMKIQPKLQQAGRWNACVLLIFLILSTVNKSFAQCTEFIPSSCSACNSNPNMTTACVSCYQASPTAMLTDLGNKGLGPASSITISAVGVTGVASVKVENINVYDNGTCNYFGGPFADPTAWAALSSGIVFTNGSSSITIARTGPINAIIVGRVVNFSINVYDGSNTKIATRQYFFIVRSDNLIVGDTHIMTVDGLKYDFQAVGEFVALKGDGGGSNLEIQTRQTAVATSGPGFDAYTGLHACVSVNTAVAARVGKHRVSYQPNINGEPDPSGLQLRVDGKLTTLDDNGVNLESGGRIMKSPAGAGAIEIDFPDGTSLVVTPGWWDPYKQWYLNIAVSNTAATKGITGIIPFMDTDRHNPERSKSWLPALPDGSNVGFMPEDLHERFLTLYQKFADAWRVTDATSLFDYGPGTTTATFTNKNWPLWNAESCAIEGQKPKEPIGRAAAEELVKGIEDPVLRANAIFDVMLTGEPTIANTYLISQKIKSNSTVVTLIASKDTSKHGDSVTFTAIVARKFSITPGVLTGTVAFSADGKSLGDVSLDASGRAVFTTNSLGVGSHQITAKYTPDAQSSSTAFGSSNSINHEVIGDGHGGGSILHRWWFWLIILAIIIGVIVVIRKKK